MARRVMTTHPASVKADSRQSDRREVLSTMYRIRVHGSPTSRSACRPRVRC